MRRAALVVLILAAVVASGCSPKSYFADRWNDAKDIFTASVGTGGGAKARIGPVHVGAIINYGSLGLRNGECTSHFYGDSEAGDGELLIFPLPGVYDQDHYWLFSTESVAAGADRGKDYSAIGAAPFVTTGMDKGTRPAYWSQIEVVGGLGLTVRLGFNPGELLDFLAGWFGADIYGDDLEAKKEREKVQKTKENAPEAPSAS